MAGWDASINIARSLSTLPQPCSNSPSYSLSPFVSRFVFPFVSSFVSLPFSPLVFDFFPLLPLLSSIGFYHQMDRYEQREWASCACADKSKVYIELLALDGFVRCRQKSRLGLFTHGPL